MGLKLPAWIRTWYRINIFILPFDYLFIVLRPRSLESRGGELAYLFPIFQVYAKLDSLFDDMDDPLVYFIYFFFQPVDMAIIIWLAFRLGSKPSVPLALLCLAESIFCATKTLLYLMYSWKHIIPSARLPITIMNASWVAVPLVIAVTAALSVIDAFREADDRRAKSN